MTPQERKRIEQEKHLKELEEARKQAYLEKKLLVQKAQARERGEEVDSVD